MSDLQNTHPSLQANTADKLPTIRQLSTAQQSDWIERIFQRLNAIYGQEFSYKWENTDPEKLKHEWADALGGFHAADIAAALQSCRAQPKAPNLPDFAALCRQNMSTRTTVIIPPLTPDERVAAAKVAKAVAEGMSAKDTSPNRFKKWAYMLMEREAKGESLLQVNKTGWREALGYAPDADAKKAMEAAA